MPDPSVERLRIYKSFYRTFEQSFASNLVPENLKFWIFKAISLEISTKDSI